MASCSCPKPLFLQPSLQLMGMWCIPSTVWGMVSAPVARVLAVSEHCHQRNDTNSSSYGLLGSLMVNLQGPFFVRQHGSGGNPVFTSGQRPSPVPPPQVSLFGKLTISASTLADALSRNQVSNFFSLVPRACPALSPLPPPLVSLLMDPTLTWISPHWERLFKCCLDMV